MLGSSRCPVAEFPAFAEKKAVEYYLSDILP
jgi:hypothetical protein